MDPKFMTVKDAATQLVHIIDNNVDAGKYSTLCKSY